MAMLCLAGSSIGCVEREVLRDLPLPAIAVREQAFLVVVELFACLGRELEVRSQDDGVDRPDRKRETYPLNSCPAPCRNVCAPPCSRVHVHIRGSFGAVRRSSYFP